MKLIACRRCLAYQLANSGIPANEPDRRGSAEQWRRLEYFLLYFPFPHTYAVVLAYKLIDLQDDHKAFRRQLEDKRPIVESNLLSGKQYVASEPPISDNSDTEGNFEKNSQTASRICFI